MLLNNNNNNLIKIFSNNYIALGDLVKLKYLSVSYDNGPIIN